MDEKSLEKRVEQLEKEMAELRNKVQPESIIVMIAEKIKAAFKTANQAPEDEEKWVRHKKAIQA